MALPKIVTQNQFGEVSIGTVLPATTDPLVINFIVDSANGNGFGVRSVKGSGIGGIGGNSGVTSVFMHTSSTPAAGSPNPAAGLIVVQLAAGYSAYQFGADGQISPLSGSSILVTTGVAAGLPYIITSVGTTTTSGWQALGLPVGIVPAPGVAFVAPAIATTTGTGTMQAPLATGSGILKIEPIGDPSASLSPSVGGAWFVLQCLGATNSSTTTLVAKAPADGTVIALSFSLGQ